jgi:hypothetical protein
VKSQNRLANSSTTDDGDDSDNVGNMTEEPKTLAQARARIERTQKEVSFLQQKLAARSGSKPTAVPGHKGSPTTFKSACAAELAHRHVLDAKREHFWTAVRTAF